MPKIKTSRAAAKRFKKTGTGNIKSDFFLCIIKRQRIPRLWYAASL